ncbi:MAG TPA: ATP-binding cassette domain-containing protein [Tissierellaceae bacterium]|nr:ATP-binding cassette domain-containing protein [Tissierellaceae bacterium]
MKKETLSLLGPSGCGKSMTLKCIAGIEKPDEGKIILNNKVLFDSKKGINLPPQDRKVGLLFQSYALFPNMTLYENISIGIRGNIKKDNKVKEIIDRFSLNKLKNHYPHQLSGGEQQRVALARMIINEPEIFMLDEPFSALDEYLRWNIIEWIAELMERENTPTILVSHDKNEVYRLSDTVAIMKNGKIVEENTKKNIFNNPSSVYSANLIGYKNISEIQFIDRDTLYVKDWNLNLNIDNYNKNARYIGINQQNINLKLKGKNTFTFLVVDKIINYDHVMLLLKNNEEQKRPIYMKVDNGNKFSINDRIRISLDKENINLFNR